MICTLPAELIDRCIDFVYEDLSALQACSLTCRSLRSVSQFHIFRDVSVGPSHQFEDHGETACFLDLIAGSPWLGHHIHRLSISNASSPHFLSLIKAIPTACPKVEDLDLSCSGISSINAEQCVNELTNQLALMTSLQSLKISNIHFGSDISHKTLTRIVIAPPHLRRLALNRVSLHDPERGVGLVSEPSPGLREIGKQLACAEIDLGIVFRFRYFCEWLAQSTIPGFLRVFRCVPVKSASELRELNGILVSAGHSLRELTCGFRPYAYGYNAHNPVDEINWAACPSLETIHVEIFIPKAEQSPSCLDILAASLVANRPHLLRKLIIGFSPGTQEWVTESWWTTWRAVLPKLSHSACLTEVVIHQCEVTLGIFEEMLQALNLGHIALTYTNRYMY